jgi:transposase
VINSIRAHLAEFGIVARVGRRGIEDRLDVAADPNDRRVPEVARACLVALGAQTRILKAWILEFDSGISPPGRARAEQHSSRGKDKLGSISKHGDRDLRSLFTAALGVPFFGRF